MLKYFRILIILLFLVSQYDLWADDKCNVLVYQDFERDTAWGHEAGSFLFKDYETSDYLVSLEGSEFQGFYIPIGTSANGFVLIGSKDKCFFYSASLQVKPPESLKLFFVGAAGTAFTNWGYFVSDKQLYQVASSIFIPGAYKTILNDNSEERADCFIESNIINIGFTINNRSSIEELDLL